MSSDTDIEKDVNRGVAWVGLASSSVGLLDILSLFIILRFWISPSEYGIAAVAITLFPVLDRATDMGLSAAVIQRDDHTEEKISTVFWLNLAMTVVLFLLLIFLHLNISIFATFRTPIEHTAHPVAAKADP